MRSRVTNAPVSQEPRTSAVGIVDGGEEGGGDDGADAGDGAGAAPGDPGRRGVRPHLTRRDLGGVERHYYPHTPTGSEVGLPGSPPSYSSLANLILVVQSAEKVMLERKLTPDPGPEIRACGSHWALSGVEV